MFSGCYGWHRPSTGGCALYVPASVGVFTSVLGGLVASIGAARVAQGTVDAAPGYLVLAVDAFGVDLEQ